MIHLQGPRKPRSDRLSRRDLLHVGGLSLFGLSLADLLWTQEARAAVRLPSHFGRAKACILVYLFGAAPQHETFDPKPDAPAEIQGELKAIRTSVPGVHLGEGLPQLARVADRLTLVRSLTHAWPFHGVHYALTGIPTISPTVEADPNDRSLWPFLGSVLDYLGQKHGRPASPVPGNVALPFRLYARANFRLLGGPYAGFLGGQYDPVWTDFTAPGTKEVPNLAGKPGVLDPFGGIRPTDRFDLAGAGGPAEEASPQRLGPRRTLLEHLDGAGPLPAQERVRNYGRYQRLAHSLLTSPRLAEALDFRREPPAVRERYGMTLFGQSLLASRRLIEAGGRCVTVLWDAYGDPAAGWDTHYYHYPRLKQFLLPGLDQSFSALLLDLETRGLLDETLVLCLTEHGRTPRITNTPGGGREHWSRVYSAALAGGGIARGRVVGRSDASGGTVADTPVSPKDILATALFLLGIDPHATVPDLLNRPVPVAGDGALREEFLG